MSANYIQDNASQFQKPCSSKLCRQIDCKGCVPVFASPSPYQDCAAIPWFLHALVQAIAVSQSPSQLQLLSL